MLYFFIFLGDDSLQLEGWILLSPLFTLCFFLGVFTLNPFTAFLLVGNRVVLLLMMCVWSFVLFSDDCIMFWVGDGVLDEGCNGIGKLFSGDVGGCCNCDLVFCFQKMLEKLGIKSGFLTFDFLNCY